MTKERQKMAHLQRITSSRLGEILTHSGLITPEQLEEALGDQKKNNRHLGELLVERGYVSDRDIAEVMTTQFGLPYLSPKQYYTNQAVTKLVPTEVMLKHMIVPLDKMGDVLTVCISGPVEPEVLEEIERKTGCSIQVFVGTAQDVKTAIAKIIDETS